MGCDRSRFSQGNAYLGRPTTSAPPLLPPTSLTTLIPTPTTRRRTYHDDSDDFPALSAATTPLTRQLSHLVCLSCPRALPPITPNENPASHEAMSDFSSSLPSDSLPSPLPRHPRRTDLGLVSRPRTPAARPASRLPRPHRRSPSDAGGSSRIPSLSNVREIPPRTPSRVRQGHAPPVTAQTPPSWSKVRSYSAASLPCNEISLVFRMTALGRPPPAIRAHQLGHAPTGCATQLPPLLVAQLNAPPSLSSSLSSLAPSLAAPPTPQGHRFHPRRHSAFIIPSPSVSSFRNPTPSCAGDKVRCEPSRSPLSHGAHEARRSSHR